MQLSLHAHTVQLSEFEIILLFCCSVIENCKSAENGQAHKSTVALAAIQEKQI